MPEHDFFLIYLHGFNSAPASRKAVQTADYMRSLGVADRIIVPPLSHEPMQAIRDLEALIRRTSEFPVVLAGSSLGGYYATWLAEMFGLKAALINPAVRPYERWEQHLGLNRNFITGETYAITHEHIHQLRALECETLSKPDNYLLLVQTGDEVLDYRDAVEKYRESPRIIQQGGNHSFVDYPKVLPAIFDFFTAAES